MKKIIKDGITFVLDTRPGNERGQSKGNTFVLVKDTNFLAVYDHLVKDKPKNIMEVGMFEGGSLVYFDKIFKPEKLVGIDMRKDPIKPLENYIKDKPYIKTYYGRYQDKAGTLSAARSNFPEGIDLVVDDASHFYEETKATFEMLFPLVRAGGHYIIEDWGWNFQDAWQGEDTSWFKKVALSNMIFELIGAMACNGVIGSIFINKQLACIKKGKGTLPENALDLEGKLRGRKMPKI